MTQKQNNFLWVIKTLIYLGLWAWLIASVDAYWKFFFTLWFGGLFFQSLFFHRYAAHKVYTMSPAMEKTAYIGAWIFQGSSYMSAYAYGLLHRIHHAYTDTEMDPHSPNVDKNAIAMMLRTAKVYILIFKKQIYRGEPIAEKFKKNVPNWKAFDKIAHRWESRLIWGAIYASIFIVLAIKVDHAEPWEWLIIVPLIITSFALGSLHGVIVNWIGHTFGYKNHHGGDRSRNIGKSLLSIPMNFFMMGEDLHNNHHAKAASPNFAHKWWEYDFIYTLLVCLDYIKVIKLDRKTS